MVYACGRSSENGRWVCERSGEWSRRRAQASDRCVTRVGANVFYASVVPKCTAFCDSVGQRVAFCLPLDTRETRAQCCQQTAVTKTRGEKRAHSHTLGEQLTTPGLTVTTLLAFTP